MPQVPYDKELARKAAAFVIDRGHPLDCIQHAYKMLWGAKKCAENLGTIFVRDISDAIHKENLP